MSSRYTFYCPRECIAGDVAVLPPGEAHHAFKVLRMAERDEITMVDGQGVRYSGHLEVITKRGTTARITERVSEQSPMDVRVSVAAALIKNSGRYETMLEKAAELGAAEVIPLETARTERTRFRPDRADAILVSAMKQSGSAWKTVLAPVRSFDDVINSAPDPAPLRLICHEQQEGGTPLAQALEAGPGRDILLAIGPEGGFTPEEIQKACDAGFQQVWLGRARLRAETASIVALSVIANHQNTV